MRVARQAEVRLSPPLEITPARTLVSVILPKRERVPGGVALAQLTNRMISIEHFVNRFSLLATAKPGHGGTIALEGSCPEHYHFSAATSRNSIFAQYGSSTHTNRRPVVSQLRQYPTPRARRRLYRRRECGIATPKSRGSQLVDGAVLPF
jgi:hypothetical protein